jgi:dTDP-glucose 4,6-dehydratase
MNWEPAYGEREGFRRGLIETINWFNDPNNLNKYKTGIYNI